MFTRLAVIGLMVCGFAVSVQAADKRQQYKYLVCPPNLDYCHWEYKPIKESIDTQDALDAIETRLRRYGAEMGVYYDHTTLTLKPLQPSFR
jgi:hypothetical protein